MQIQAASFMFAPTTTATVGSEHCQTAAKLLVEGAEGQHKGKLHPNNPTCCSRIKRCHCITSNGSMLLLLLLVLCRPSSSSSCSSCSPTLQPRCLSHCCSSGRQLALCLQLALVAVDHLLQLLPHHSAAVPQRPHGQVQPQQLQADQGQECRQTCVHMGVLGVLCVLV